MRATYARLSSLLGVAALSAALMSDSQAASLATPWIAPADALQAQRHSDEFAWRVFVAVNWPAASGTRHADATAALGAPLPTVWESWKSLPEVYLADGHDPGTWTTDPGDLTRSANRFETFSLTEFPNARHVVDGQMVPLLDAVAHAKRLTEAHMNDVAYEYIRAHELYNLEGQIRAVQSARGVQFPNGTINVKAKWRPLKEADAARYHTIRIRFADGMTRLYGLTGLHIADKSLPQWLWATFEHVDNASLTDGEGWLLPSRDAFACRGEALDCNKAPAGIGLEGTVWQNYRLRGTLTRYVDTRNQPQLLANSELEAGDQRSSSCISCHARAALAVNGKRLTIFDGVSDDAQATATRAGSIGLPRPEWFALDEHDPRERLHSLDFVWSLSKAQMRRSL